MNKLTKIFTLKICGVLFFIFSQSGCEFNKKNVDVNKKAKPDFTLEWHEITAKTFSEFVPTFESLKSIFVESFLPLIKPQVLKQQDSRIANLPAEIREQKVAEGISKSLRLGWDKRIKQLYEDLNSKHLSAAYLTIARDNQKKAIGFVLMKEESIKDLFLKDGLDKSIIEKNVDLNDITQDQMHVAILAVKPGTQKKGVGKALVFSAFDHLPHIKKLYLRTAADDSNKNTQAFYEHVGFVPVYTGAFASEEGDSSGFAAQKIVYIYKNKG
jgi:GNAT superfamily N-acetyltransferase